MWIVPTRGAGDRGLDAGAELSSLRALRCGCSSPPQKGLVAGETRVKTLDVEIGLVERVELADDFASVTAVVRDSIPKAV